MLRNTPCATRTSLAAAAIALALTATAQQADRVCISGVYPHLAVFNSTMDDQGRSRGSGGECGIGAVVPWAGRLWMLTYSPHCPNGSNDKLFTIDDALNLKTRPESIGGTPAGRLIHRESQQLFIGPYAIDRQGTVRAIPYSRMPGRHTAISRHLTDPANRVYYFDMEGRVYEVDVHTLAAELLFRKPVPGWHGKGAYTGQGRYILANNGEQAVGGHSLDDLRAGTPAKDPEDMGVLAEWDGQDWRVVERKQFTDVTGPGGIHGAPNESSPVWAIGWDHRSVILKLLDAGTWHTFRLPKGTWTYDHRGGFYTEWPRIREIAPDRLMMDMHGIFWDFPRTFSAGNRAGLRPVCTHHRYVPDFCHWNGRVVLASDDTSTMANPMAGQAQSNLWFGSVDDLRTWGPRVGWGGPWVNDPVKAGSPSVPYAVAGFPQRCLHLAVGGGRDRLTPTPGLERCTGRFPITRLPPELARLPRVTVDRGDYHQPAEGYGFRISAAATVFLAVDSRPKIELGPGWEKTHLEVQWEGTYTDTVYRKAFAAGRVEVPGHAIPHKPDAYGLPHICFLHPASGDAEDLRVSALPAERGARVVYPNAAADEPGGEQTGFLIELDARGDGTWQTHTSVTVPRNAYRHFILPPDLEAAWLRLTADRDCLATAYLSYGDPGPARADEERMFATVARLGDPECVGALIRPAKHNRNLQVLMRRPGEPGRVVEQYREVDETMAFLEPKEDRADEVRRIAAVAREFEVDDASVIMTERGRRFRLPKGDPRYDTSFATGWPRGVRECESERYLMNVHGTFYEKPREGGLPKIKPVASHGRQIMDFCTWRGLLVLSGTWANARADGHFFAAEGRGGLWFGGIDDIWKLGKPVDRGGPWKDSRVRVGEPSDPYLMTGYDRKTLTLSHQCDTSVRFTTEVNVDHTAWHDYRTFTVPAGEKVRHAFPEGYGAHWVRLRADTDCVATAWFVYE